MRKINTILIANRGEIALRVMRTCKLMGIKTVAVFSDADKDAPHVAFADKSVHIGPSPVGESYLKIETIMQAAKNSDADAIHPGYGFLSENAAFAQACANNDIIFIGPPIGAIDVMGDKAKSKRAMIAAGVPCIPGYQGEDQSDATLINQSKSIGFPLMVKAAAGGGGRGMRFVHKAADLPGAIKAARSEAANAFGSDELIIERAVIAPRHVEIQVLADVQGNIIHLGERDCSVQRRNQKVIEESPCPVMDEPLRARMGKAAVATARAVDYVGAGTVEFLLDDTHDFFFLEMNTRLQVEHPVTEMVYGIDLVAEQIKAAQGEVLQIAQDDVEPLGHAVEVRLYAEDPENEFLPSTGPVTLWQAPSGARVDSGIETGGEISPYYDSMVAKIIAHGLTRDDALLELKRALAETALIGPKNNRDFLIDALNKDIFKKGDATTAFIKETYGEDGYVAPDLTELDIIKGALAQYFLSVETAVQTALPLPNELLGWGSLGALISIFLYDINDTTHRVTFTSHGDQLTAELNGHSYEVSCTRLSETELEQIIDRQKSTLIYAATSPVALSLVTDTRSYELTNIAGGLPSGAEASGGGTVVAPMHGQLLEILVSTDDTVKKGDKIAILEAMKMQHEILAEIDGTVTEIAAKAGTQIAADDLIMEIEAYKPED
jgi:geranyl-CoA carboxylase alpha subunit